MARILIVGGYGAFGARVAERLARMPGHDIIIAGRRADRAAAAALALAATARCQVTSAAFDVTTATAASLRQIAPAVVINASGPFQNQTYILAEACIEAGVHAVDLADARGFVTGITALDAHARARGVTVISGASTVPGVSSAAVAAHRPRFKVLRAVEMGVSPANSFDPGAATTASILSYVGRPIAMRIVGRTVTVHGWQGLRRWPIAGVGQRLMSYADVPDLDVFPARDGQLETVIMRAGVEVAVFHLGLSAAAALVRAGLIRDLPAWTGTLLAAKRWFSFLGSDRGGMRIVMTGTGPDDAPLALAWDLAARSGHGPYIPAIPSVILARKLANGARVPPGARPCYQDFTLAEFEAALDGLDITSSLTVLK